MDVIKTYTERYNMVYLVLSLIFVFTSFFPIINYGASEFNTQECGLLKDRITGAFVGAAIGDALGRLTEFIPSYEGIQKKFGKDGLRQFSSAMKVSSSQTSSMVIPYTDDTVMALELAKVIFNGRRRELSVNAIMELLAFNFARLLGSQKYMVDPLFDVRAHGITNLKAGSLLESMIINQYNQRNPLWWLRNADLYLDKIYLNVSQEGGSGSVMRSWPIGIIYADSLTLVKELADKQSCLTHRHPMARAASVAIAVGVSHALLQKSPDEVAGAMIMAAQEYDDREIIYKKDAKKVEHDNLLNAQLLASDQLLTSDMIRYAYLMAQQGKEPLEILGTINDKTANFRSAHGYLLSWSADEAVAAALYIFMRHPDDLVAGILEAVNTPGDSDTIATLVGALIGARTGVQLLHYCEFDYSDLENVANIKFLAAQINAYLGNKLSKNGINA